MTNGRSGSSLVCGLFAQHGCWSGPCKEGDWRNPDGFYENSKVYSKCYQYVGTADNMTIAKHDGKWPRRFMSVVESQGWDGHTPMVMKHLPQAYPIWDELNPVYVTVRRSIEGQMASRKNINKSLSREILEWREDVLDFLEEEKGAIRVDGHKLIQGDTKPICKALEIVGIKPQKRIFKDFINPNYWKYGE